MNNYPIIITTIISCLIANITYSNQTIEAQITDIAFSPDQSIYQLIKTEINKAEKRVDVCVFLFEYKPIADLLIETQERGVNIRVLTDVRSKSKMKDENGDTINISSIEHLHKNHVQVRAHDHEDMTSGIMHHKFILIDEEISIVGSYNFQHQAETKNSENFIVVKSKQLNNILQNEFNKIYKKAQDPHEINIRFTTQNKQKTSNRKIAFLTILILSITINTYFIFSRITQKTRT